MKTPNLLILPMLFFALILGAWKKENYKNNHKDKSGDFDFYVLSLSWSPTYCQSKGASERDSGQCKKGAKTGFIVHGLWPQYKNGYPSSCPTKYDAPDFATKIKAADIMPSNKLIEHEWKKHGTCSGLNAAQYFGIMKQARQKVFIPEFYHTKSFSVAAFENAFIQTNRGLKANAIAITSDKNRLKEVRICLDKSLNFRACDEVDRKAAGQYQKIYLPAPQ